MMETDQRHGSNRVLGTAADGTNAGGEEAVERLGPERRLVGIVTPAKGRAADVACLLVNAGVIHRIGPHRINVRMARALAAAGITTLRMDVSGLGDSALPANSTADFRTQAIADMRTAMDHLQATRGVERFLLVGICSGAYNGFHLAQLEPRLVGLAMFDGFAYATPKARLAWLRARCAKLAWSDLARLGAVISHGLRRSRAAPDASDSSQAPSRSEYAHALNTLVERGVAVLVLMSGGLPKVYSYESQLRDAFRGERFLDGIDYSFMPGVDHTITSIEAQGLFVGRVLQWATRFGVHPGTPASDTAARVIPTPATEP